MGFVVGDFFFLSVNFFLFSSSFPLFSFPLFSFPLFSFPLLSFPLLSHSLFPSSFPSYNYSSQLRHALGPVPGDSERARPGKWRRRCSGRARAPRAPERVSWIFSPLRFFTSQIFPPRRQTARNSLARSKERARETSLRRLGWSTSRFLVTEKKNNLTLSLFSFSSSLSSSVSPTLSPNVQQVHQIQRARRCCCCRRSRGRSCCSEWRCCC